MTADDLLEFDDTCPYCRKSTDVGETFDGEFRRCGNCGKLVCATEFVDGTMCMVGREREATSLLTSRQRTRALWRKLGRR